MLPYWTTFFQLASEWDKNHIFFFNSASPIWNNQEFGAPLNSLSYLIEVTIPTRKLE